MTSEARVALAFIRKSFDEERYIITTHFAERMDERGLMWPDVLCVVDDPTGVRNDGLDRLGRPKWVVEGPASDDLPIEIVCVLDEDNDGNTTVLITLYWE
ncbi:MAG TPA: DUF4258 domain-containing protein [Tepidisphaeraceae bacterium]|jgi:hypothetical protein|nr:DUF4258 domain-containing protein [Tepidisphaeraceae bacterium]